MNFVRQPIAIVFITGIAFLAGCGGASYVDVVLAKGGAVQDRSAVELPESPRTLSFEPNSIDLGELTVNTTRHFSLRVRNKGEEQVIIEQVAAGCTCSDVTISANVIEPGDMALITGAFRAGAEPTEANRAVTIKTTRHETYEVPPQGARHAIHRLGAGDVDTAARCSRAAFRGRTVPDQHRAEWADHDPGNRMSG